MQSVLLQKSCSLNEFARQNAIGFTTVRGEIKAGRLAARKVGRQTIITAEDAKAWQEQLPKVQPRVRVASIVESPIVNGNSKAVQSAVAAVEPASEQEQKSVDRGLGRE